MRIIKGKDGTTFVIPTIVIKCDVCDEPMIANATKYKGEFMFLCGNCKIDIMTSHENILKLCRKIYQ